MVRRIRALAAASGALLDDLRLSLTNSIPELCKEEEDQPMGVLVRNAFRDNEEGGCDEADVSRVWAELSSRVLGPFGRLALEGPAFAYADGAGMQSTLQSRDWLPPCADFSNSLPGLK
jgi:hypothetical protein